MTNDIGLILTEIKKRRKSLGYTQEDMARKCGIKQSNYSRMESGRQLPKTDTLISILDAVNLRLCVVPADETKYRIMWRDRLVAIIVISKNMKEIKYNKIEPDGIHQPFSGTRLDMERFYRFIKSRCYEDGRGDLDIILKQANLKDNNPYDFIRVTHGVTYSDDFWIMIDNEQLTWEEVKVR